MRPPRNVSSYDADQHSRPVMLKNKGPFRALDVKIGDIKVEIWDYCKPVAEPYACLTILNNLGTYVKTEQGEGQDMPTTQVVLDQMHASVLAQAITAWAESLSCYLKGNAAHALTAEFESMRLRLYGPSQENGDLRADLMFTGPGNAQRTATLTYLEARLLADTLGSILPDDEEGAE